MFIQVVKSKIHRVTVTGANLDYIGSITIDQDLMDAAGICEGERVFVVDNNNGERFDTYAIPGERGSTHIMFIADVTAAEVLSDNAPMTYAYYHANVKPKV